MSCNCQINLLVRPKPTEAFSHPQSWGLSSKEFQGAIWLKSMTMGTKQSVPSISPANQPVEVLNPPGLSSTFLFSLCLFHSQSSYYHWHVPKPVPLMFIPTLAHVCLCVTITRWVSSYLHTSFKERANSTFTIFNGATPRTTNVNCIIHILIRIR